MADMEIYIDCLASSQINTLNTYMDTARNEVQARYISDENELYFRTLELFHIHEDEYFNYTLRDGLISILRDVWGNPQEGYRDRLGDLRGKRISGEGAGGIGRQRAATGKNSCGPCALRSGWTMTV